VLEASYEATLLAALKQAEKHGYAGSSNVVYLTMLGGGVFGNDVNWILESIHKACISVQECDLDVRTTLTCPFATCAHLCKWWAAVLTPSFVLRATTSSA